jgi:tetratricopeptide (TPR) repeat protein
MRVVYVGLASLDANKWPLVGLLLVAWFIRSKMAPAAEQADKLVGEGKSVEALPLYEKSLEKNPEDRRALLGSASCMLNIGQSEKALERIDKLLKIEPNNNRALALKAACYTNTGRHEQSIETATKAIENQSGDLNPFPYLVLAMSQAELKRFDDALRSINKYLEREPENSQALFIKGTVLEELERYDEALDTYSKAARSRDGHIRGCIARGILLSSLGRIDEGLAEFDKVLPHEKSIRQEELAKLKLLLNEAATKCDAEGYPEKAERLREAAARVS